VSNLDALKIQLDHKDMSKISALNTNERIVNPSFAPAWD